MLSFSETNLPALTSLVEHLGRLGAADYQEAIRRAALVLRIVWFPESGEVDPAFQAAVETAVFELVTEWTSTHFSDPKKPGQVWRDVQRRARKMGPAAPRRSKGWTKPITPKRPEPDPRWQAWCNESVRVIATHDARKSTVRINMVRYLATLGRDLRLPFGEGLGVPVSVRQFAWEAGTSVMAIERAKVDLEAWGVLQVWSPRGTKYYGAKYPEMVMLQWLPLMPGEEPTWPAPVPGSALPPPVSTSAPVVQSDADAATHLALTSTPKTKASLKDMQGGVAVGVLVSADSVCTQLDLDLSGAEGEPGEPTPVDVVEDVAEPVSTLAEILALMRANREADPEYQRQKATAARIDAALLPISKDVPLFSGTRADRELDWRDPRHPLWIGRQEHHVAAVLMACGAYGPLHDDLGRSLCGSGWRTIVRFDGVPRFGAGIDIPGSAKTQRGKVDELRDMGLVLQVRGRVPRLVPEWRITELADRARKALAESGEPDPSVIQQEKYRLQRVQHKAWCEGMTERRKHPEPESCSGCETGVEYVFFRGRSLCRSCYGRAKTAEAAKLSTHVRATTPKRRVDKLGPEA